MQERITYIDSAKGIGILLVIMGHTVFPLHEAISVFHMPLFFFIGGVTLKMCSDFTDYTVKKINRIFIPYLFFSIFWAVFDFILPLPVGSDGPLWFLPTMFSTLLFCQILLSVNKKWFLCSALTFCIAITFLFNHYNLTLLPFNLDRVFRATPYMLLGYTFTNTHLNERILNTNKLFALLWFACFSIIYSAGLYLMIRLEMIKEGEGFMRGEPYGSSIFLIYIVSFSAIIATILFSKSISNVIFINWLGKNSLVILCVHYPFTQFWNTFISSTTLYESIAGRLVCALISYLIIVIFCIPLICFCKKFIPKLTGYFPLLG